MSNTEGASPHLVFLSFADSRMAHAARRIARQAREMGVFDVVSVFDERALNTKELAPWQYLFTPKIRGYGYWCWKPFLIEKTLRSMNGGDVLLYCDAGTYLNPCGLPRFEEYLQMLRDSPLGVLAFDATEDPRRSYCERCWTKGDLLRYFGCEHREDVLDSPQIAATQVLIRHCAESLCFLQQWNEAWMTDIRLIDDSKSGYPDAADFKEHRHDQSIFSLLYKLHGGKPLPYHEKYSRDWRLMHRYPIWSVRDRGTRVRSLLGYLWYCLMSYCPVSALGRRNAQKASELYGCRPWLWSLFPLSLERHQCFENFTASKRGG